MSRIAEDRKTPGINTLPKNRVLKYPKDHHLSLRVRTALTNASIFTMQDLRSTSAEELCALPNFGRKCLEAINEYFKTDFKWISSSKRDKIDRQKILDTSYAAGSEYREVMSKRRAYLITRTTRFSGKDASETADTIVVYNDKELRDRILKFLNEKADKIDTP